MKDSRVGEALWSEWHGYSYDQKDQSTFVFFTIDHVDISDEIVKRALASSVQRNGITDSLGQAFKVVEATEPKHGYAGAVGGDTELTVCDIDGETFYGEFVDEIFSITWVEIDV